MQLIPVIDVLAGAVVHAVRGQRDRYRPIESSLCRGSDPLVVGLSLLEYCAARTIYVADLDALLGRARQYSVIARLAGHLKDVELWLDAGFRGAHDAATIEQALGACAAGVMPVFGTESLVSRSEVSAAFADRDRAILSLDRVRGAALDAAGCWSAVDLWPRRVIVMTLDRVGSAEGPDLETFRSVRAIAPSPTALIGAGGLRDADDVRAAKAAGADAWLVASALHDGRIPPATPARA